MPHPAMTELCSAASFTGRPPETLSTQSVLAILDWTNTRIDVNGILYTQVDTREVVSLHYGRLLRSLIEKQPIRWNGRADGSSVWRRLS